MADSGMTWMMGAGLLLALLLLLWWRRRQPPAGMVFSLDDEGLRAAQNEARASLPVFWAALAAGAAGDSDFMLKFDLNHGLGLPDRESIWARDISVADGQITGRLANAPRRRDAREGDAVVIDPAAIDDWTFFRNDVAQGHFVTRLMLERAPPAVAAAGRQQLGW